ncbi:hypothetical protein BJ912DRAFT_1061814 [Pholiota molesta]|nr:hypothetical protein BJ912DRAFT_1061814 [Pholiota molesta]
MAPLAGKPPFATDEPDSFYETPRAPQPAFASQNPQTPTTAPLLTTCDYDSYLKQDASKLGAPSAGPTNRNSGIGALLMDMGGDDDDDSDDDDGSYPATGVSAPTTPTRANAPPQALQPGGSPSQTRPLATPQQQQMQQQMRQQQQQQYQQPPQQRGQQQFPAPAPNQHQQQPHMQPIAAPRPGYPAPIAALNLARPEPAVAPAGRQGPPPAPIQLPSNPHVFGGPAFPMPASPAPSAPHPLLPPVTPITPAFIRPSKSPAPVNVSFAGAHGGDGEGKATPRKPIMRGNSEETLLPGRGEKGDDFWRRFSMVVKEESTKKGPKESSWLHQTKSRTARYSRWVWITGMILIIVIAGGTGAGVYLTRNSPGNQQPTAIGGSANNAATATSAAAGGTSSSSLHVSPTNTVARREARAVPTQALKRHLKNRGMSSW